MKKIYLLTGPKNSGKSTRLMNWALEQNNIIGIVCPRDTGKRKLYSILSNSVKEFEVDNESELFLQIGNYKFLQESFDWAGQELLRSVEIKPQWIVIDEIGPLELQGKGFDKVVRQLISKSELKGTKFMLVVRESLINDMIQHYKFEKEDIEVVDFI